jgi:chromosome segregation ATPase
MFQATRIAYGARRFRVVTLNGEMIETSGAMSGGGKEKMHGKMGTQARNRFILWTIYVHETSKFGRATKICRDDKN